MELREFLSCFFSFTPVGVDETGPCEALYAFGVEGDPRTFLVYDCDGADDLCAAVVVDYGQVVRLEAAEVPGAPAVDLAPIADDAGWQAVHAVMAQVEAEED